MTFGRIEWKLITNWKTFEKSGNPVLKAVVHKAAIKAKADNFSYGLAVSLDTRAQRKSLCNRFKLYPIYVIDFPPFAKRTFIFSHPPLNLF